MGRLHDEFYSRFGENYPSRLLDFLTASTNICGIIGQCKNSAFKKEKDWGTELELYYKRIEDSLTEAELEIHNLRLLRIQDHLKAKILEIELKNVYNELFKKFPAHASELIVRSSLPTKKELEQPVIIK